MERGHKDAEGVRKGVYRNNNIKVISNNDCYYGKVD